MSLSIMFYANTAKANPKTGKIPLYVRVTLNRRKAESRLNIEIPAPDIMKWDGRKMCFTDRKMSANALLNTIDKNFDDFRHHNGAQLSEYTVKGIRDIIIGKDSKPDQKIECYIDKYHRTAVESNAQMAEGTKTNYRKAIIHLKAFLKYQKSKDAVIRDINIKFAFEFKDYLLGTNLKSDRVGMKESSALDNVKRLRTIFDRAVDEGLMPSNFFKRIKLKSKHAPRRGRLDIQQVKKIYDLDVSEFPTQRIYKDMFMFSVFPGLAYADFSSLKQSNLNKMGDGNTRLFLQRAKTDIITEMHCNTIPSKNFRHFQPTKII